MEKVDGGDISDLGKVPKAERGGKFQVFSEQSDLLTLNCSAAEGRKTWRLTVWQINPFRFQPF